MAAVRGVVTAILVGVILVLAGCSHDDAVLTQKNPPAPTSTLSSSPNSTPGAASSADVDAVVARLTDPKLARRPLGTDLAPTYLRIEMLAIGLTPAEASCVATNAAKSGGSSLAALSIGDAADTESGLDPSLLLPCVSADRLTSLAGGAPNFGRVPAADLRDLLSQLGTKELTAGGLSTDEATCVVAKTVGEVPDGQLPAALSGAAAGPSAAAGDVRTAVQTCLSPARVAELAG
jgi:hypothetical protein